MSKNRRLNQELIFLKDRHSFGLKDLMDKFQISKRTALRDVEELESLGLALYSEAGRHGGYRILPQDLLTPIYFSSNEISAIFYALKALEKVSRTPFDQTYPEISEKLLANLSQKQKEEMTQIVSVIDYYTATTVNSPQYLAEILASIINGWQVSLLDGQYDNCRRELQFYDLFYREGIWFSHAYDAQQNSWHIIRCDYVKQLIIDKNSQGLDRQDLQEALEHYQKSFWSVPFKCRLTDFGKELFLKNHYENMTLVKEDDSYFIQGAYNPSELHYMVHYLMEFGKHVTVLQPPVLKEAYIQQLTEMIESYQ